MAAVHQNHLVRRRKDHIGESALQDKLARHGLVGAVVINATEGMELRGLEFLGEGAIAELGRQSGRGAPRSRPCHVQMWGPAKARKHRACLGTCRKPHSLGALLSEDKRIRKRKRGQCVNERDVWRRPRGASAISGLGSLTRSFSSHRVQAAKNPGLCGKEKTPAWLPDL